MRRAKGLVFILIGGALGFLGAVLYNMIWLLYLEFIILLSVIGQAQGIFFLSFMLVALGAGITTFFSINTKDIEKNYYPLKAGGTTIIICGSLAAAEALIVSFIHFMILTYSYDFTYSITWFYPLWILIISWFGAIFVGGTVFSTFIIVGGILFLKAVDKKILNHNK